MIVAERERLIQSDISSIENRVRHTFNQGYDLGYKDGLQKSETVTEFADRCRECGAKHGELGHWISIVVNGRHKIKCNKCDYTEPEYATHIRNYCPYCGTKMVEQESEEI